MRSEAKMIPALIVSGFLGAGKTTLVRHLLRHAQSVGRRVAVVSNEFGALGIDRALLGRGGEAYVELEGGCVCCQLSNELLDTLQMLWERVRPDQVIVETSGVALPADTQVTFWREPVASWVSDDLAAVVVDAEQVLVERELDGTFEDQVTSADLLLLNKIDLVSPGALRAIERRLRELEPEAPIVCCAHGEVDPDVLFPPEPGRPRIRPRGRPASANAHSHERFAAREVEMDDGIDEAAALACLRDLGALRVKGFVCTADGVRLVQGVGPRVQLTRPPQPVPPELVGRVVAIVRA